MFPKLEFPAITQSKMKKEQLILEKTHHDKSKFKHKYLIAKKQVTQIHSDSFDNDPSFHFLQNTPIIEESVEMSKRSQENEYTHMKTEDAAPQTNIFESKEAANNILNKIGPKYDSSGQLITRSILGKPEWFQKNNQLNKFMQSQNSLKIKMNSKIFNDNQSTKSKMKLNNMSKLSKQEETLTK